VCIYLNEEGGRAPSGSMYKVRTFLVIDLGGLWWE